MLCFAEGVTRSRKQRLYRWTNFLLVVPAIPNAMLCMTTTAATVQKAAFGRKKSPPLAVKKTADCKPSLHAQWAGVHSRSV